MGKTTLFIEGTPLTGHLSGIGHVTLETIKALDDNRFQENYTIKVFVPFDEKAVMQKYSFQNVKIVYLPFPHKVLSLLTRLPVGLPLDTVLGRGVYVFPNFRNWTLAVSSSMTYIHDACFMIHPEFIQPRNLRFLQRYMGIWKRRTNKIVAVSQSSAKEIREYLRVKDVEVVSNAVDTAFYTRRSTKEIESIRKKYGLQKDYFLYLGNIEPRKNLETLIDAYVEADVKKSSLLLIGGDGWLNEAIFAKIKQANKNGFSIVKNKQFVPDEDIPALMSGATALIQPSWHEGFGLAVAQSIACGTPVICSDIPSLREVTEGFDAFVGWFQPADTLSLATLIKNAKPGPLESKKTMRTWNDAADDLIALVEKVKGKKS